MSYEAQTLAYRAAIDEALACLMDACVAPEPLLSAMRYSLLAEGKRLRPTLLLAAAEMAGGERSEAMPFACALEMIHAYSLIHDDLPAMDNDDVRRGRPTNHKVFGEGMALLAGDGLLSLAFETMLSAASSPAHVQAMQRIARAAGSSGMVGGQCVDLACERSGQGGPEEIAYIHRHKTADLITCAVSAGLALAGETTGRIEQGERFAQALGIAFQIQDDLLDLTGDAAILGKNTGMDAARGKLTWPGVFGVETARRDMLEKTDAALAALEVFGEKAAYLRQTALALLRRDC